MSLLNECQINHETAGDADILRLVGAMDSFSFPRLETALTSLASNQRNRIVLDCSGLTFINSAALGTLIGHARRTRQKGGDLKLAACSPKIAGILEMLGFNRILQIFPDAAEAVKNFTA